MHLRHYHITRVFYISMVAFLLATGAVLVLYSQTTPARALPLFSPFGGIITDIPVANPLPPPAVGLNPACPYYSVVNNVDLDDGLPPEFGVFIPTIPPGISYDYNNLFIPDTPIIGGVEPIPCLGGTAPLPLYPMFYDALDGGFYLDGTGSLVQLP
jgi:hypothetical protein